MTMGAGSMVSGWYYSKPGAPAGQQEGPFTWEQFYAQARAGTIAPDDLVWHPQLPQWLPAAQVPGLLAAAAQPGSAQPGMTRPETTQPGAPAGAAHAVPPYATPAYAAGPQPSGRRRSWLLPVLIPVIAVVVVGAALGSYFAFWHGQADSNGGSTQTNANARSSTTTEGQTADLGGAEVKLPDSAKLVETAAWGEVPVNQIGVILADGRSRDDAEALAQALGGTIVGELGFLNAYQIETAGSTEADLQAALDQAAATPGVELAFPNMEIAEATEIWGVPQTPLTDPAYGNSRDKGFELIGAQKAWNYVRGSGLQLWDVHVGVVDSGIYKGTGEFDGDVNVTFPDPSAGELKTPDKDTNQQNGITVDDPTGSHGTMVSGTIGADPKNGGQTGVASPVLGHHLTIYMINYRGGNYGSPEVPNPDPNDPTVIKWTNGKSYSFGTLVALTKQIESGAKIINCSFGSKTPGPQNALIAAAYRKFFEKMATEHPDVTFVCAAGNEAGALTKTNYAPAGAGSGLPNVITVGNVMNDGSLEGTDSNVAGADGEVTLAAPGQQVIQAVDAEGNPITEETDVGNGNTYGGGTSAAAPQVSAAAAILLSLNPNLTAAEIKNILSKTARPGPEQVGGKILAIDQAVLEVINQQREKQGLPAVTGEELEKAGMVDAVATTTDQPAVYSVRGILAMVPMGGTEVTINGSAGVTVEGEASQSLTSAGEVQWPSVTVAIIDPKNPTTITVTRKDTGAASIITLERFDLNGAWNGTLTFSDFTVDPNAVPSSVPEGEVNQEGCSLAMMASLMEKLKGLPLPMRMDITADESGNGTAVTLIDVASLASQLNAGEGSNVTVNNEPQTIPFTSAGTTLTFHPETTAGATTSMSGTVSAQGATLVITGAMTGGGKGFTYNAVWSVTKE
jgi:hypothetical protein